MAKIKQVQHVQARLTFKKDEDPNIEYSYPLGSIICFDRQTGDGRIHFELFDETEGTIFISMSPEDAAPIIGYIQNA